MLNDYGVPESDTEMWIAMNYADYRDENPALLVRSVYQRATASFGCRERPSHRPSARKGKDSVNNGIQYIQGYTIIVHPRCVNFITEISNYTWAEDKFGAKINVPIDDFNHLMDAMRYGLEDMLVGPAFSFD